MITKEVVNLAIDYIIEHLNDEINIDDVAKHCHFSKYYFSRIFKGETGESVYSLIKRLKMERSALKLLVDKDKSITDIAYDFGYSPSNYSWVFKEHHNQSPNNYRKNREQHLVTEHPFIDTSITYHDYDYYNSGIRIKEFKDIEVVYERYLGNYSDLNKHWQLFMKKYGHLHQENSLYIERSFDDPTITDTDRCIYDICMTTDLLDEHINRMVIKGGKFAVYNFEGSIAQIFEAYQGLFNIWFPTSGYILDDRIGFQIYGEDSGMSEVFRIEICIPIK